MIHQSNPPILLPDVIENLDDVVALLENNAPYTPLGGWYRPGADPDEVALPMWFQNDWVHADLEVEGSDLFLWHKKVIETAKHFYNAEVILPTSVYVNLMAAIDEGGPAHTDNPRFQGRDRSNTPMALLRSMLWSNLFDQWAIVQATSIWWMNDVEGGAFRYWPDGPESAPHEHLGCMANTALVGDNHGMFHQVGPVGPFDEGTRKISARAELSPTPDGSGDWAVTDGGAIRYRAPLESFRVSVLWKADVYQDESERKRLIADPLTLEDVIRIFNQDLEEKRIDLQLDPERLADPLQSAALASAYPEAIPVGATSMYATP
jgi:hypothetical protein